MTTRDYIRAWLTGTAIGLAFVGIVALAGCPVPPPPAPQPPAPVTSCIRACDHVVGELGCPGASYSGCNDVCDRVGDPKFTNCIATAPDCGAADRCDTK